MRVRRAILATIGLAAASMSGCVASEASRFEDQMSSVIASSDRATADVAWAFGLDDAARRRVSIAALRDPKQTAIP